MATTSDPRSVRLRLGLTQAAFAELIGVHPMTVSRWERGVLTPNRRQLAILRTLVDGSADEPAADRAAELVGLMNLAFVDVSEVNGMKLSASNQLKGRIVELDKGPVSTRVVMEIVPKVHVTSLITTASANRLGLRIGKKVVAIIKATEVIIGTD